MATEFVDEVRVSAHGGDGGAGAVSFHREKHKPRGGPDGGDGGRGGSIVLVADPGLTTLAAYVRKRIIRAPAGTKGQGNHRKGADGRDVELAVPVGTVVRDVADGQMLADLAKPGVRFELARGGRAGRGNASLRSREDRIPNYAERGEPGRVVEAVLELHLVADVGLLGPPNAGKSTLLSAVSRATPKIGAYPFTTLSPGLGVVEAEEERFVLADLPGLIEGAAEGRGLGLRFLRHAERCAVLAVVVDLASEDPRADAEAVAGEVARYEAGLAERIRVVVGNKTDLPHADPGPLRDWAAGRGARFVAISAASGDNIATLVTTLIEEVRGAGAERGEAESFAVFRPVVEDPIRIVREDGAYRVHSERVERAVAQMPVDNPHAARRLQQRLRTLGVESALRREGVAAGDEVRIGSVAFEYHPDAGRA